MGIVKKQASFNTLISYAGIALGYLNTVILFPNIFSEAQFGLTRVLLAISAIYIQISSFGTAKIALRFFPFFKNPKNYHNGFLWLLLLLASAGFLVVTSLFLLFKDIIIEHYSDNSPLINQYLFLVIPLSLFMLYFLVLESYFQAKMQTVLTGFLRNVLLRLLWTFAILLFYFQKIDFDRFLQIFISVYLINSIVLLMYDFFTEKLVFQINQKLFAKKWLKHIVTYGWFSILSGFSLLLVTRTDIIMIGFMIDLKAAAVYSIALYFASVIFVPAQSIIRISAPLVAHHMKSKNLPEIHTLYQKTSVHNFMLGGIVFILIFHLLPELYQFLPKEYHHIEYVFLFLGLSKIVDMLAGINGVIINNSKYY
ncbi:MAG: hypothetical protein D6707_00820, partial [Bacteroidetes bacterium]